MLNLPNHGLSTQRLDHPAFHTVAHLRIPEGLKTGLRRARVSVGCLQLVAQDIHIPWRLLAVSTGGQAERQSRISRPLVRMDRLGGQTPLGLR